jgi:hypothetical protein
MKNKKLTQKDIEEAISSFFKDNPEKKEEFPLMKNTKWEDEDGNKYSSWQIGKNLHTGDGGAEMFMNTFQKMAQEYITDPVLKFKKSNMQKDSKYFVPNIEDIRIGYECEIWWNYNMLPENKWCPIKIGDADTQNFEMFDFIYRIRDNHIRTPYLTKEQIEAEGWIFVEHDNSPFNSGYRKENHRIQTVNNGSGGMYISRRDENGINVIFEGVCPSINEFRFICKLLNI